MKLQREETLHLSEQMTSESSQMVELVLQTELGV